MTTVFSTLYIVNIIENYGMNDRYDLNAAVYPIHIINFTELQSIATATITDMTTDDTEDVHYTNVIVANINDLMHYVSKLSPSISTKVQYKISKYMSNAKSLVILDTVINSDHKNYVSKCINDYNERNSWQDMYQKAKEYVLHDDYSYDHDDNTSTTEVVEQVLSSMSDKNFYHKVLEATTTPPQITYNAYIDSNILYQTANTMINSIKYDVMLHKNRTFIIANTCEQFRELGTILNNICALHCVEYVALNPKNSVWSLKHCTEYMAKYNVVLVGPKTFMYDYYFNDDEHFNILYSFIPNKIDSISQCHKIKGMFNVGKVVHQCV
jgi:hypothetical protein